MDRYLFSCDKNAYIDYRDDNQFFSFYRGNSGKMLPLYLYRI
jgi:hypothetical protein